MSKIIRTQAEVEGAEMSDIVASFNALTGQSVKRFSSRAVGEQRLKMAIMAAADAAGHLGVPKGTEPKPLTAEERAAKGEKVNPLADEETREAQEQAVQASRHVQEPSTGEGTAEGSPDPSASPYKPGTLAHQLDLATRAMAPITPKPRKDSKKGEGKPRVEIATVVLTNAGTSKLQPTSARAAIIDFIKKLPGETATMEALVAHFEASVKGHLQKLVALKHVRCLDSEGKEVA